MNVNSASNVNTLHKTIIANLAQKQIAQQKKAPTALNAPMIMRVHNVRPGCGSCGK
jgi:hypothetical protein